MKILFLFATLLSSSLMAMTNGDLDKTSKYEAVGSLKTLKDSYCTATLISSKWIVTAAHCTFESEENEEEGNGEPLPPEAYQFILGKNSERPLAKIKLKQWVRIPTETIDMAFGELNKEVPLKKLGIIPIPPIQLSLTGNFVSVGYGVPLKGKRQVGVLTPTIAEGNVFDHFFGNKKNLENYIKTFHAQELRLEDEPLESIYVKGNLLSQYNVHAWDARGRTDVNNIQKPKKGWQDTCFGDSGGPLLKEVDGKLFIIGVTSRGLNRTCATMGTVFTTFGEEVQTLMTSLGI